MTEGEDFIKEYFSSEKIKYRDQATIDGLKNDSKNHRVADFYLPQYKIYVEYFGQWNVDGQKARYREKRQVYIANHIPCVILYPENLGIIDYIFKQRVTYVLKRYKLEKELRKYRFKILFKDRYANMLFLGLGLGAIFKSFPWKNDWFFFLGGVSVVLYQLFFFNKEYRKLFKD